MNKIMWLIIAFVSGTFLPLQAGLNGKLGKSMGNPIYASLLSFIVGAITVALYIALTKQPVNWSGWRSAPSYVWLAGVLGAFYVTAVILAFPQIGPALTFGLVVAGQMVISLLLDHYGILVPQSHPINFWRIIGMLLIVGGVVVIRKF